MQEKRNPTTHSSQNPGNLVVGYHWNCLLYTSKTNREKYYGEVYFIKKYVNGKWRKVEYGHGGKMAFNSIAYVRCV